MHLLYDRRKIFIINSQPIKCESESRKSNQAVTLFGGWNENAALSKHELNLYNVYKKLMKASFKEENIKVFFNSTVSSKIIYILLF